MRMHRVRRAAFPLILAAAAAFLPTSQVHAGDVGLSLRTEPLGMEKEPMMTRRSGKRGPKLINLSTDSSNIGVELGFTVPLLKVPLEGMRSSTGGYDGSLLKKPIDLNVGALFVAGSLLVTVMGIVPAVYQAFAKPKSAHEVYARSVRDEATPDVDVGWVRRALGAAEAELARRGVDARSCGSRALCTALAGAAGRVRRGRASSLDLVLHGVARSPWVSELVYGTKLQSAASGEEDTDYCERSYTHCQFPVDLTTLLVNSQSHTDAGSDNKV